MHLPKRFFKKALCLTSAVLIACSTLTTGVYAGKKDKTVDYSQYIFDNTVIHKVEITISDEDWADLLANPKAKTKYCVSVDIDGEHLDNVSMATKGNSSLSIVANSDSERYSFKLNFGYYEKDQRCHGAKKLNLSNIYTDATYMKDYISYEIFRQIGIEAPLCSYAQIYINGQLYGLYLAMEEIDGAFVDRAFEGNGEIYKPSNDPENGAMGPGDDKGFSNGDSPARTAEAAEDAPAAAETDNEASDVAASANGTADATVAADGASDDAASADGAERPERPAAGDGNSQPGQSNGEAADGESKGESFSGGRGGEDLAYIDDNVESYPNIFNKAETKINDKDKEAVVKALKNLSEGNIYEAVDADEVARYFAAHNFVMNYDSYTGSSLHNYYLLEKDGLLSMLPWDYNQAFGAFGISAGGSEGSTDAINYGIDSPLNGMSANSRPMWAWIVSDEEYTNLYHSVFDELISTYFESGKFEAEMQRVYELIRPYVESDPSAFFTVEEFDTAYETLLQFCLLRAQSIRKQLDGTLAAVTSEQAASDRIDGSAIDISLTQGNKSPRGEGDSEGDSASDASKGERQQEAAEAETEAEN